MKKIPCGNPKCYARRPHHESMKDTRPHRVLEMPDDFMGKAFCSFTCALASGFFSLKEGWIKDPENGQKLVKGSTREIELNPRPVFETEGRYHESTRVRP